MDNKRIRKYQKIATVLGGMLLIMPNGLMWIWGNIAVYSLSYVAVRLGTGQGLSAPWMTSFYVVAWIFILMLCNVINKVLHKRWLILAGIVITDVAIFMSYFTIQNSFMALNLTLGFVFGIGTGFIYGNAMQLVIGCADKDVGLLSCILQSSFAFGGILLTQVLTWYTNPENEAPSLSLGKTLYFTQKDILDRGPSMFLAYGCCSLTLHVVGFVLMLCNPAVGLKQSNPCDLKNESSCEENGDDLNIIKKSRSMEDFIANRNIYNSMDKQGVQTEGREEIIEKEEEEENKHDNNFTPKQMIQKPLFYVLWIAFFCGDFPYVLLTNYYKLYGQLWIPDDHFLATLGTAMITASACTRFMWGLAMDKYGVKNCFIVFLSSLAFMTAWFCFAAMIDRWVYLLVCIVYGSISSALYGCFMATVTKTFGKKHISTNYGILLTSSVVFNILAPYVVEKALMRFGWYYTFISASALNLFNLILCVLKVPRI